MDLHEWLDYAPGRIDSVEVAGYGIERQYKLQRLLTGAVVSTMPRDCDIPQIIRYHAQTDGRLAHRHFTRQGICSLLVETSPRQTYRARHAEYRNLMLALLSNLASPQDARTSEVISATFSARLPADMTFAGLYAPKPKPILPLEAWCGIAFFLLSGYMVIRRSNGREIQDAPVSSRVQPARLSISDALTLSISPRMKVALIRTNRPRPSDRTGKAGDGKIRQTTPSRMPMASYKIRSLMMNR